MKVRAHRRFWDAYDSLPPTLRQQADKQFALWLKDSSHPSLRFKKVGENLWSARVDRSHRALARWRDDTFIWFWIGTHDEYEQLLADT